MEYRGGWKEPAFSQVGHIKYDVSRIEYGV